MNMNHNRKMKKLGSRDETGISQQSVLCAMDRFVHAVDTMNETVMVPSRLMDMNAHEDINNQQQQQAVNNSTDLYSFYNMLNGVKNELIWGSSTKPPTTATTTTSRPSRTSTTTTTTTTPPSRRNSIVSSMSLSDSEADAESCSESDSGFDNDQDTSSSSVASRNFRHHLNGLYQALQQLTDTADNLTGRYQQEVGGAS